MLSKRTGQSTIELAFVLVVAILALVAMWPLLKDAIAGRWKSAADVFSFGLQFDKDATCIYECLAESGGVCTTWGSGRRADGNIC